MLAEITLQAWLWLALGAFIVGLGKGGLPGVGNLTAAIFALVLPSKESVGVLLPVLIAADFVAIAVYRRHAEWRYILRLLPWTVLGVVAGYFLMDRIDNAQVRTLIGAILLGMTALHFGRQYLRSRAQDDAPDLVPHAWWFRGGTGIIGGFATMVANAAGPVTAFYFLAVGLPKLAFIGTGAWFYLIINVVKLPFQAEIGILHLSSLKLSATLAPVAMFGAIIAPFIVRLINQKLFERLIWLFIVVAGLRLLF